MAETPEPTPQTMRSRRCCMMIPLRKMASLSGLDVVRVGEIERGVSAPTDAEKAAIERVLGNVDWTPGDGDDAVNKLIADTVAMLSKAKQHWADRKKPDKGEVPCLCGGMLRYSVAKINGHMWAHCDSCQIGWME